MSSLVLLLVMFTCTFSIGMEKPVQKSFYAPDEVFLKASKEVQNNRLKRLQIILQTHVFQPERMVSLLKETMGDKAINKQFMGCFVLLLQYGAPLDLEIDLGPYAEGPITQVTPVEYALIRYPDYVEPLILFGAKISPTMIHTLKNKKNALQLEKSASIARKQGSLTRAFFKSQMTGRAMPVVREREAFSRVALNSADTFLEAVQHEDIHALKRLLSQPFQGDAREKDFQLTAAIDGAIQLENFEAIDELAKYASIGQRLRLFFFRHPNLLLYCAKSKCITPDDLAYCKSHVPESRHYTMHEWSDDEFNAERGRVLSIIDDAQRILERPEPEIVVANKKVKSEKKDEQL